MLSKKIEKNVLPSNYPPRAHYDLGYTPHCLKCGKIVRDDEDAVVWDGMHFAVEAIHRMLSPITKLVMETNPEKFVEEHNYIFLDGVWHTHCAADHGMHLISDAIRSANVTTKVRFPGK